MAADGLRKHLETALIAIMSSRVPLDAGWGPVVDPIRGALYGAGVESSVVSELVESLRSNLQSMAPAGVVPKPFQTNVLPQLVVALQALKGRDPVIDRHISEMEELYQDYHRSRQERRRDEDPPGFRRAGS